MIHCFLLLEHVKGELWVGLDGTDHRGLPRRGVVGHIIIAFLSSGIWF